MRVKDCKGCPFFQRLTWDQRYQPKNYHAVGFSHAYGWCKLNSKRVVNVKKSECGKELKIQTQFGNFVVKPHCEKCHLNICVIKVPDGVEVWCGSCSTKLAERKTKIKGNNNE